MQEVIRELALAIRHYIIKNSGISTEVTNHLVFAIECLLDGTREDIQKEILQAALKKVGR